MSAAVFVEERYGSQRAASEADLRRLDAADERVGAVAADLFIVNQLDRGARREAVEIVAVRERILRRCDDWLGYPVLGGCALEVVLERERHLDRANEIVDRPQPSFQHAGAEAGRGERGLFVEIVFEAAHLAGLGILVQRQRMPAMKISVRGDALNVRRPLMRVVRFHPGFAKVAFDWRGAVKRHADCDRRRCGIGGFGLLDYVRAVLAGIQFGAERVERRGKSLWICLEKKKQGRGGRSRTLW